MQGWVPDVLANLDNLFNVKRAELLDPSIPRQDKPASLAELVDMEQASMPQLRALNTMYSHCKESVPELQQLGQAWAESDLLLAQQFQEAFAASQQRPPMPAPEQEMMSRDTISCSTQQQLPAAADATAEGSNFVYAAVAEFGDAFTPSWVWAY
jgi:hypothetical protein